jgi:predicted MFS family arabinose efflux permease
MSESPPELADLARPRHRSRDALVIGICIFATVLATQARLGRLPFRAILKNDLGFGPAEMARFFALAGIAWFLKPLAGALSDHLRLFGTRRRHYLLLSGVLGAATWGIAALVPRSYEWLVAVAIVLSAITCIGNTAAGGLLVDLGRSGGSTGALSSVRVIVMNASSLIAGPLGGWLAGRWFGWTCAAGATLLIAMALCVAFLLRETTPGRPDSTAALGGRDLWRMLRAPGLWWVIGLTFLFYGPPGFQTALYYFQRDDLGLTDQEIGLLTTLNCTGGMLGALCYARLCQMFGLQALLRAGVLLSISCTILYLAYRSCAAAIALEPVVGFISIIGVMPLHELTARTAPPHHEAFGYALILSVGNLAIAFSDVTGTEIMTRTGMPLPALIIVSALASLPALFVVARLPLEPRLLDAGRG